jgi:excisionase family DNA binding protein
MTLTDGFKEPKKPCAELWTDFLRGMKMAKGRNVLTTGDVAKICNVAARTVSKWFDSGQLRGYRIPGSKERRIPVNELLRFMKQHNMPSNTLPVGQLRILIVDSDGEAAESLAEQLAEKANYGTEVVTTTFETGLVAQRFAPHVILLSLMAKDIDAAGIAKSIRQSDELETTRLVALANNLRDSERTALLQKGFDACVADASDVADVVRRIEEVTAIIY